MGKLCSCCGKKPGDHLVVQVGEMWGSPFPFAPPKPTDIVAWLCPICFERLFRGNLTKNSIQGELYGYEQETG
jgi:hypothetical protein